MKKWILAFLAVMLFCGAALASPVSKTLVDDVTLNDTTTSASGTDYLGSAEKTAFFVSYDETDATAVLSVAVTCQISYDNSNWFTAYFRDYVGGATLQSSETISSDSWYYFWFDYDVAVPYVKITLTPTGHDATHTADVSVYSFKKQ